jgi:hypothetical protein
MWVLTLIWGAIKALGLGMLGLARAIPIKAWLVIGVVAALAVGQYIALAHARRAGDRAARAELAPLLMRAHADAAVRYQQAADAEGRSIAYEAGLNRCIGERNDMATITSAVLTQRDRARAEAQRALNATRQELAHAYAQSVDSCAAVDVPGPVLGVLDAAAAQAGADTDAERGGPRAAVRARAEDADRSDACAAPQWLNVPRYDGLDHRVGCEPSAVQRGQDEHRDARALELTRDATQQCIDAHCTTGPSQGEAGIRVLRHAVSHYSRKFAE